MTRCRMLTQCGAVALLGLGLAGVAAAAPVTYAFSGVLDSVDPALDSFFTPGDTISGTFTYESTTVALPGGDTVSAVYNALTAISFTIGSVTGSSTGAPEVQVGNLGTDGTSTETTDRFALVARDSDGLINTGNPSLLLNTFFLRLDQNAGTLFGAANGGLPTGFSLSDFDSAVFGLDLTPIGDADPPIGGHLISLDLVDPVPEPTTMTLLGIGLLGLAGLRRRRAG